MATISRFEEIEAWQQARVLVRQVYSASRAGPLGRNYALRDQIQRAALSVMSNIAEGFERKQRNELLYHLRVARASCAEVQSQLYAALDTELLDPEMFQKLQEQAEITNKKISGFQRYLKNSLKQKEPTSQPANKQTSQPT